MKKEMLLNEIIQLRDQLMSLKFQFVDENNTDTLRHLSYSVNEVELTLKEKMLLLDNNH